MPGALGLGWLPPSSKYRPSALHLHLCYCSLTPTPEWTTAVSCLSHSALSIFPSPGKCHHLFPPQVLIWCFLPSLCDLGRSQRIPYVGSLGWYTVPSSFPKVFPPPYSLSLCLTPGLPYSVTQVGSYQCFGRDWRFFCWLTGKVSYRLGDRNRSQDGQSSTPSGQVGLHLVVVCLLTRGWYLPMTFLSLSVSLGIDCSTASMICSAGESWCSWKALSSEFERLRKGLLTSVHSTTYLFIPLTPELQVSVECSLKAHVLMAWPWFWQNFERSSGNAPLKRTETPSSFSLLPGCNEACELLCTCFYNGV